MADVRIRINDSEVRALLGTSGGVYRDLVRRSQRVVNRAKVLSRVDTGLLRSSITYEIRRTPTGMTSRVGTNVQYAIYVERRYPFLEPALQAART